MIAFPSDLNFSVIHLHRGHHGLLEQDWELNRDSLTYVQLIYFKDYPELISPRLSNMADWVVVSRYGYDAPLEIEKWNDLFDGPTQSMLITQKAVEVPRGQQARAMLLGSIEHFVPERILILTG